MKERKLTAQEQRLMVRYPETDTFKFRNENPKGHITGDCTIRALAGGLEIGWSEALKRLTEVYEKYALFDIKGIEKFLGLSGWVKRKMPKHADGTRYTGNELAKFLTENFPNGDIGNVVVSVSQHMYCIRPVDDGEKIKYKICDTWDSGCKSVGNFWVSKFDAKLMQLDGKL